MKKFWKNCSISGLLLVVVLAVSAQSDTLRIGVVADIQYADKADANNRYYRASIEKLQNALKWLNGEKPALTVVLGDYVDQGSKDFPKLQKELEKSEAPVYGVLGNHDFPKEKEENLHEIFMLHSLYYTAEYGDWRLIFLNTNELSTYAIYDNKKLNKELNVLLLQGKRDNRKNQQPWNGGISEKQMRWLEKEIEKAGEKQQKVIVFSHHPLFPENGLEALNNREILNLLSNRRKVKAVISGHHHEGNFEMYEDLPCITLEGMIETEDQSAFGIMELSSDRLIIRGNERMTSRNIQLRQ